LQAKIDEQQNTLSSYQNDLSQLKEFRAKIIEQETIIANLQERCNEENKRVKDVLDLQDHEQSLNTQIKDLNEQLKNIREELVIAKKALEESDSNLQKQRDELESKLSLKQDEIDILNNELNEAKVKNMALESSITSTPSDDSVKSRIS